MWWLCNLYEWLNDCSLHQIVDSPTRITNNTSSTIDLCITNNKDIKIEIKSEYNISDHECVAIKLPEIDSIENQNKIINIMKYEKNQLIDELKEIDQ